jgi:Kef-type K+ transport system membrane component KefB
MGVFFASIGFLIDPFRITVWVVLLSAATAGVATVAKFVPGVLVLRRAAGVGTGAASPLAAFLIPRAEISLIIAQYGIVVGVTPDLLAVAMVVMIVTALLPSLILGRVAPREAVKASSG